MVSVSFKALTAVVDLIYNPTTTKLLAQASERGITAVNGLEMLVAQAKYAVDLFLDTKIPDDRIEEISIFLRQRLTEKEEAEV